MAPRVISLSLGLTCAIVALLLALSAGDARQLRTAETAGANLDFLKSLRVAREVSSEPSKTRAYAVRAYAAVGLRDFADASKLFEIAVRKSPNDWELHRDWSRVLVYLGRLEESSEQRRIAKELNPRAKRLNPLLSIISQRSDLRSAGRHRRRYSLTRGRRFQTPVRIR